MFLAVEGSGIPGCSERAGHDKLHHIFVGLRIRSAEQRLLLGSAVRAEYLV